jgi:hypothetical protein
LNEFLNKQVQDSVPQNPLARGRTEIKYKHTHQVDKFYEIPRHLVPQFIPPVLLQLTTSNFHPKVRVTHDKASKVVKEKIIKGRLEDLSIHNPKSAFDCRISINYEIDYIGDMDILQGGEQQPDRYKDRLSYSQSYYQFDLTKVETTKNVRFPPCLLCSITILILLRVCGKMITSLKSKFQLAHSESMGPELAKVIHRTSSSISRRAWLIISGS